MGKVRIGIYIPDEELLKKVEKERTKYYMSRGRFTMLAWRVYLKYLEKHGEVGE